MSHNKVLKGIIGAIKPCHKTQCSALLAAWNRTDATAEGYATLLLHFRANSFRFSECVDKHGLVLHMEWTYIYIYIQILIRVLFELENRACRASFYLWNSCTTTNCQLDKNLLSSYLPFDIVDIFGFALICLDFVSAAILSAPFDGLSVVPVPSVRSVLDWSAVSGLRHSTSCTSWYLTGSKTELNPIISWKYYLSGHLPQA